ncbi:MAG: HD-GYP domain-containing protein [Bacillota bacterium]|uniref:HD-GYP domain-containing protein n=1 Tax=unclassified Virgibacillus TaxID=2620237 RepID=UPI001965D9F3|nr:MULTISPECIES: HD-GYP domain-containing protein [unclassified Virgibacillus]MCC2250131.1 HD-GYP domain-containing protein [Virgibacillus sp. AGTR]MDY7045599.1 HD-GYP domain-containing protein [Virgibacillus sp. M23]QRZ19012.1 HD-GYP domain-containing protein [Virgibacillus sp. AGTR]
MQVSPLHLIPGCVLMKDVEGKTSRPIIPKQTVLTEQHIVVLQKFLVKTVHVSPKLADGSEYQPKEEEMQQRKSDLLETNLREETSSLPFAAHYQLAVKQYKALFVSWQNGSAIDITQVRKLIIPLLGRMKDISQAIYTIHHYATREDYFFHHNVAVAILSAYLGYKTGYAKGEWLQVGLAGFLSDCGMARIDPAIVKKHHFLTTEDLLEVKKHPTYSYRLTEKLPTIKQAVKQAVLQHHERMDGSGYPLGLSKGKIHRYARIVAVCDMYHAMICDRLYKEKQSPFKVMEKLRQEQFSKLDPDVVHTFVQGITNFPVGTKVKLSNAMIGEIVFTDANKPTRPMIRLQDNDDIMALQNHPTVYIEEILESSSSID